MATITTNPYTMTITGNTSVSANLEKDVPAADTVLVDLYTAITNGDSTYTITIPSGVTVVKLLISGIFAETDEYIGYLGLLNSNSGIWWSRRNFNDSGLYVTEYIGVTPGKTYILNIYQEQVLWSGWPTDEAKIYYSSSINQQTPTILDY